MKTPRRRFLKAAALAGVAVSFPGTLTAGIFGRTSRTSEDASELVEFPRGLPRLTNYFESDWRFHLGDAPGAQESGFDDHQWRTLDLPHDWSIEAQFDRRNASAAGYLPGGVGWYRKTFRLDRSFTGKRVGVLFEGVYMNSDVWINGHHLGKRPYGYITFDYNLTPHLLPHGQPNHLVVKVDHTDAADTRWYNGSGIYRHVWLVGTSDVHIPTWGTHITVSEVSEVSAVVMMQTRIKNAGTAAKEFTLISTIEDERGKKLVSVETAQVVNPGAQVPVRQKASLNKPKLWSPDSPQLYSLVSRIKVGNNVVDEFRTPFGVRTFHFDANEGFHLNGRKTVLKGVCLHHDASCLGAAVPDDAWERRLKVLKEVGCNAIRTSHNPASPALLDLCDRMGFLVMEEAFDEWARPKKKWLQGWNAGQPGFQGYAKYFNEWGIEDIKAMVERDKNRPSIILWSIGNEIDYPRDPYFDPAANDYTPDKPSAAELPRIASNLIKAIKEIDTTRPVTAAISNPVVANRIGLAELLDVVGYNYKEADYRRDRAQFPNRKFVGSENSHALNSWKAVEDLPYVSGQFLWTGFDFLGEAPAWPARSASPGLLDSCGFRKPAFFFRKSLWSKEPVLFLGARPPRAGAPANTPPARDLLPSWTWPQNDGDPISIVCYTNCDKVELFLNDQLLGEKTLASAPDRVLVWQTRYFRGKLRAVGFINNRRVSSVELTTAGEPKHLKLEADFDKITADGRSLAHVEVSVVDDAGNLVHAADKLINFDVSGPGRIIGIDSGDVRSHENFKAGPRKAFQGRCLVVVQSTAKSGKIRLTANAPGLGASQVSISSRGV